MTAPGISLFAIDFLNTLSILSNLFCDKPTSLGLTVDKVLSFAREIVIKKKS